MKLQLRLALWMGGSGLVVGTAVMLAASSTAYALVAIVAGTVASTGLGYVVAGRGLQGVHQVKAAAGQVTTNTLDTNRLRLAGPFDEVRELADTFDDMLGRISVSFDAQRRFVSNASHELRTPLTVMRTEIEVALSNPEEEIDELRRMGEVVRDRCLHINDLIESLLWLARAEAEGDNQLSRAEPTDLGDCAEEIVATAHLLSDELELSLAVSRQPAPVVGNPDLLERVAGNLIENAIRHNVPGGRVWLLTGQDDDVSWLVVGNTGSDVDAETVPSMFEPFSRGGEARVGRRGAGLGMSIVRAVCRAHHGTVEAKALPQGGGLEVRVEIPTAVDSP